MVGSWGGWRRNAVLLCWVGGSIHILCIPDNNLVDCLLLFDSVDRSSKILQSVSSSPPPPPPLLKAFSKVKRSIGIFQLGAIRRLLLRRPPQRFCRNPDFSPPVPPFPPGEGGGGEQAIPLLFSEGSPKGGREEGERRQKGKTEREEEEGGRGGRRRCKLLRGIFLPAPPPPPFFLREWFLSSVSFVPI